MVVVLVLMLAAVIALRQRAGTLARAFGEALLGNPSTTTAPGVRVGTPSTTAPRVRMAPPRPQDPGAP
jgi:hypothetical protein